MTKHYDRSFYEEQSDLSRRSALQILPVLLDHVPVRSACDVGCGVGTWLGVLKESGVEDVLGIDGDYVDRSMLQIPPTQFRAHDLSTPLELGRTFDLAMSLEVAEHLPADAADRFVDTLTRLAPLVLFSAAVPGQGGVNHVNEQWQGYWAEKFGARGYKPIDFIRGKVWNNPDVAIWYAQNVMVYCDESVLDRFPGLAQAAQRTDPNLISIVHPRFFAAKSFDFKRDAYLSQVLGALPGLVSQAVRRRFR